MDHHRFDAISRAFAQRSNRRHGVAGAVGLAVAGVAFPRGVSARITAQTEPDIAWTPASPPPSVCDITAVRDLQSLAPGSLIAYEEITPQQTSVFPADGRVWRVRYVSTGRDNTERTLVCGIVAAPADPASLDLTEVDGEPAARILAWTHGTIGITARCQPSHVPDLGIWGPPPFGIGAVGWGAPGPDGRRVWQGPPADGILASMIARGWIVTATDYQDETSPGAGFQPFIIGKVEAANALDNFRAAHHLLAAVYGGAPAQRYDTVVWGHSQGGHTAMWTGQVHEPYMTATAAPDGPRFRLRGVALEAPGSNLISDPETQPDLMGFGQFDWTSNQVAQLTGVPEPMKLAPMFVSYIVAAWQRWSAEGPGDPAEMPAGPDTGVLDPSAMLTPAGVAAANRMAERCWTDGAGVVEIARKFANTPFIQPILSEGKMNGDYQMGNFDETCATTTDPAIQAWCAWLRYQNPGPTGVHDMPKVPMQDGALVPLMMTHGADDQVVHCVTTTPAADGLPQPKDCVSIRLYDSLLPEYCPEGAAQGSLRLTIWNPEEGVTTADHSDVTGLAASAPGKAPDALEFTGSPLEQFITAAFAGTVEPGCSAGLTKVEKAS